MSLQEKLYQLFLLEKQVRGMQSRFESADRRLNVLTKKLAQLTQQHLELSQQHKATRAHAQLLEADSQGVEGKIAALRAQMGEVHTNKEYSALLVEVNTLKNDQGKIEEDALTELERVEQIDAELKALVENIEQQKKLVAGAESELAKHESEVGAELESLTTQRDAAAADVPLDVRDLFNRMSDATDGEAMAAISEEDRRNLEYCCGGCYMQLPVECVNRLLTRANELTTCPSCSRILFVDQDLRSTMSAAKK